MKAATFTIIAVALVLLAGALAAAICCMCALLAALAHTLKALLLPMVFAAMLVGAYVEGRPLGKRLWITMAAGGTVLAALLLIHDLPLMRGWNSGEAWGYSIAHAVLASIVTIGWPAVLLTGIGFILLASERRAQNWYWIVCVCGWVFATVALPGLVPYHAAYAFLFAFSALVLAGVAIGTIYEALRLRSSLAASATLALLCVSAAPSLASHYVEGSRWDLRTAAAFVRKNWQPCDRIAAFSPGIVNLYAGDCCGQVIPLSLDAAPHLRELASETSRLWIILENTRGGLPTGTQDWLFHCATHRATIGGRRLDEALFSVEVYVYSPRVDQICHREKTAS